MVPINPGVLYSDPYTYDVELPLFKRLLKKFPSLTIILVHGYPSSILPKGRIKRSTRKIALDIVKNYDAYVEVPAKLKDYDMQYLYKTFGPSKLLWGSEFVQASQPAAEYAERLHYLGKELWFPDKERP